MSPGDLVRFTVSLYRNWEIGIVIRDYAMKSTDSRWQDEYYYVLTKDGERLVSEHFMKKINDT